MTGEPHLLGLALLVAGGAFLTLVNWLSYLLTRRYRTVQRVAKCPVRGVNAEATLVYDAKTRRWTGAMACTARRQHTCELACVRGVPAPEASPRPEAATQTA